MEKLLDTYTTVICNIDELPGMAVAGTIVGYDDKNKTYVIHDLAQINMARGIGYIATAIEQISSIRISIDSVTPISGGTDYEAYSELFREKLNSKLYS